MDKKQTIVLADVRDIHISQSLAVGEHKQLFFTYDIGRQRIVYVVEVYADGMRKYRYNTIEEAIEAYNDE